MQLSMCDACSSVETRNISAMTQKVCAFGRVERQNRSGGLKRSAMLIGGSQSRAEKKEMLDQHSYSCRNLYPYSFATRDCSARKQI